LLGQLIQLGGKRRKRSSVRARETDVAEWKYEVARLGVIAETTAAFVAGLARQEDIRVADDQIRLAKDVLREVEAQVRAGAVSAAEVPRAELEISMQQVERGLLDLALRADFVRLATAWGAFEPTFSALSGDLRALSPIPHELELVARMTSSPELERWQAEVATRHAAIQLEDAGRIPDMTLGIGPRHFNASNDWALVVGLEMPIPIFDRNQGARRASRSQLSRSREQQRAAELRLRSVLARSYQGLASAYAEAMALRDEAIPIAERAYAATRRGHRQGALRLTEVLDSQRSLFALQTRLVGALAAYHLSRAKIEALIGGPIQPQENTNR
jgi:cobalt-zinc-cadmium efflux system outer membrane protein